MDRWHAGKKPYYGWIVVSAAAITSAALGTLLYGFGVFFKSFQDEFGWTRAEVSSVMSVFLVVYSLCALLSGWLTRKYGPRIVLAVGSFIVGIGVVLCSRASSLWQLILLYGIMTGMGTSSLYVPTMSTVQQWFTSRRKGLATGIVASGVGISIFIFAPLCASLLETAGWRVTFVIWGCALWVLIILAAAIIRRNPADMGLKPYGANSRDNSYHDSIAYERSAMFSAKETFKNRSFWLIYAAYFCGSISQTMIITHLVRFGTDIGMSEIKAAEALGWLGVISILGKMSFGTVSDVIGRRRGFLAAYILHSIAMLWLVFSHSPWMLYVFVALLGLSYGGWNVQYPAILADYFGGTAFPSVLAVAATAWGLGGSIGPILGGYIFDLTGNYQIAFIIGFVGCVLAVLCVSLVKPPRKPDTAVDRSRQVL